MRKTRVNHEIRISPIRLINENNEQVGVIDTRDALRMAEDAGLDLVEIQADSRPPLCKIMDYGKYQYEQSKKGKGGSSGKTQEIKEVRLGRSAKIDDHDVQIRVDQARRFLMDGDKVIFIQRFRGREMAHQNIGMDRLRGIVEELSDIAKVEMPPRSQGRQISMMLTPEKQKVEAAKRELAKAKAREEAEKEAEKEAGKAKAEEKQAEREAETGDTEKLKGGKKAKSRGDNRKKISDDPLAGLIEVSSDIDEDMVVLRTDEDEKD